MPVPPVVTTIVFLFRNYVRAHKFWSKWVSLMLCDITLEIFSYLLDMLCSFYATILFTFKMIVLCILGCEHVKIESTQHLNTATIECDHDGSSTISTMDKQIQLNKH